MAVHGCTSGRCEYCEKDVDCVTCHLAECKLYSDLKEISNQYYRMQDTIDNTIFAGLSIPIDCLFTSPEWGGIPLSYHDPEHYIEYYI